MKSLLWIVLAVACNADAQAAIKLGATAEIQRWQTWLAWPVATGLVLYAISFVLTVRVYADYPLSVISPLMAGAIFALTSLVAAFFFGEAITSGKVLGMVLIGGGIYLLARSA